MSCLYGVDIKPAKYCPLGSAGEDIFQARSFLSYIFCSGRLNMFSVSESGIGPQRFADDIASKANGKELFIQQWARVDCGAAMLWLACHSVIVRAYLIKKYNENVSTSG